MPAPKDRTLPVHVYHRKSIKYAGTVAAVAGTAIGFNLQPVTNLTTPIFGILESDANPQDDVTIAIAGETEMLTGGAIPIGSPVGADFQGRAILVSAGSQSIGRALTLSIAAGQRVQVLITREGIS
jgi:Uncharacterized conserved protein (DUF2190)